MVYINITYHLIIVDKKNYNPKSCVIYLLIFTIFGKFLKSILILIILVNTYQLKTSDYIGIKNILYMRMVYLYQLEIRKQG